jgi:hypothetical protein
MVLWHDSVGSPERLVLSSCDFPSIPPTQPGGTRSSFRRMVSSPFNSLLRQFFLQLTRQLLHVCGFTEPLNLWRGGCYGNARVLTELLQHLEDYGEFLLGEHTDLQI